MPYIRAGEDGNAGDDTTGVELYYEDQGSGAPVVLIHGYLLNGRSWRQQTRALLDAGFRVIAYDRRGYGRSAHPHSGHDADTLAADLHSVLTALDLTDAALVGFSMGTGEVARYLSTYGSGRIAKAAFLAPVLPYLVQGPDNPEGVDRAEFERAHATLAQDREAFLTTFFEDLYHLDETLGSRIDEADVQAHRAAARSASRRATEGAIRPLLTDYRPTCRPSTYRR